MPCITYDPVVTSETKNKKADELTALLCEATAILEANDLLSGGSLKLKKFYQEHLADDKKRLERERNHVVNDAYKKWYDSLDWNEKLIVDQMDKN